MADDNAKTDEVQGTLNPTGKITDREHAEATFNDLFKSSFSEFQYVPGLILGGYFVLGILLSSILIPGMSLFDSIYFTVNTLTAVGFGDIYPSSPGSQIIWSLYILGALAVFAGILALATASLWTWHDAMDSSMPKLAAIYGIGFGSLCLVGTIFFTINEPLSDVIDSFAHAVTILTTVAYGDGSYQRNGTKWFTIFYMLVGVTFTAMGFVHIVAYVGHMWREFNFQRLKKERAKDMAAKIRKLMIAEGEKDGQDQESTTRHRFLMFALKAGGRAFEDDVAEFNVLFDRLDMTNDGVVDLDDFE